MNKYCSFIIFGLSLSMLFVSCTKKPLTLDENTSMKTLLNSSDEEIKDLVIKEASEKANLDSEDLSIEYILRDKENQAIAVKMKINNEK